MSDIPDKQIKRLRSLLSEAEMNLSAAKELLISILGDGGTISAPRDTVVSSPEGRIIEGIFDGQIMIGPDGKNYPVPANYASISVKALRCLSRFQPTTMMLPGLLLKLCYN